MFYGLAVVLVAWLIMPGTATAQRVIRRTIAHWRFEPGQKFLEDSSGNGHNLVHGSGAASQAQPVPDKAMKAPGSGSAHFDGTSVLMTDNRLNLSRLVTNVRFPELRCVEISWYQRVQSAAPRRVLFEHSRNFKDVEGAFSAGVNSAYTGTPPPPPGQGFITYRPLLPAIPGAVPSLPPNPDDGIQLPPRATVRAFPHALGVVPPGGTWEKFRLMIAGTTDGRTAIALFDSRGFQISTTLARSNGEIGFANERFYIGARDETAQLGFVGNIDELLVENVILESEPSRPFSRPGDFPGPIVLPFEGAGPASGVIVDAEGMLRMTQADDPQNKLLLKRIASARANLNPQLAQASPLRKISLNRLEAAVRARLEMKQPPTEEMQYLAGLTRVRYVFYYPESKDIVLAGPAEAWALDGMETPRALQSSRPTLQLQDLIVALRAFPPSGEASNAILVSIDPTAEGLAKMQAFLHEVGPHATPADTEQIIDGLRNSLGMQRVRVEGIAANTHFAKVLLECDYRMKLIGIGLERPPVKIMSYVDRAASGSKQALQRWYFTPDYQCVRMAADGLGLQLVGDAVHLVSENQTVDHKGGRAVTKGKNKASEAFTTSFNKKYSELATSLPVFAEMRNCIDLAIAAAFIQQEGFYRKAGWAAEAFHDESALPVETAEVPRHTETVVTAVWKHNRLLTPVGGGVLLEPREALHAKNRLPDEGRCVSTLRDSANLNDLPVHQWWWD